MMKYLLILLIIIGILFFGLVYVPRGFDSEKEIIFNIKRGEGFREISLNLEKNGLIWWGPVFRIYVLTTGKGNKLQAGYYFISPSMNIPQIAEKFAKGDIAKEKITIPEGFTSVQIKERSTGTFPVEDSTGNVPVDWENYEGYLFPDTYYISYDATEAEIIKMMTDNFNEKTAGLNLTSEVVIMASILEKEVKTKEEKELAADVLWKRLKAGIPLQVDAGKWTYDNLGLPPKPIANPGIESILAALYPKESPYWYYLSKPDGQTIFSKTLEEHNYAKAKYLR